jgi:hypothetical protein
MRSVLLIASLAGILLLSIGFALWGLIALSEVRIGVHGWVALALGVALSLGVGVGLMALVFYSSRRGYDDGAHRVDGDRTDGVARP